MKDFKLIVVAFLFGLFVIAAILLRRDSELLAAASARFQVGSTYNVVWNCIPEGLSSLADYMITQAGGPDSETLCRQEVLTVTAVGEDGFLDVYDQREKDKLDEAGHKAKPHPWVVNPAMMQAWTRVVPKAERQASR